jgi:5-methylcytosine-specific restriction endonuclease McrA
VATVRRRRHSRRRWYAPSAGAVHIRTLTALPGVTFRGVTAKQVCTPGYSGRVRNVPQSEKNAVYREYGVRRHAPGSYEVDHLISLELGGSNSIKNLWPEKQPGARSKDKLQNRLHAEVCMGNIGLRTAQRWIVKWWLHGG